MKPANASDNKYSEQAYRHYVEGRFLEAVQSQLKAVNVLIPEKSPATAAAFKRLGLYAFAHQDYRGCAQALRAAAEINDRDPEILGDLAVTLTRLQQYTEAIPWYEKALALQPDGVNWLDGLTHCYGALGNTEAARRNGEQSIGLKAQVAEAGAPRLALPALPPLPPFDTHHPEQHIIAYSLWGNGSRYIEGALRNARLAPDIYPGWTCRFYCDDSVPIAAIRTIQRYGAQIVHKPKPQKFYEGLLWRFEVASDPAIRRFLVRDADSLLGVREKAAVDAWLCSDRHFHVMRDFYCHTELILAGLWGGVGGILPPVDKLVSGFKSDQAPTRNFDQWLLRASVWPRIRRSVLIHDSWFRLPDTQPFPGHAWGSPNTHVGQDFSATLRAQREPKTWDPASSQNTDDSGTE